jgi:hypothetical protein
MTRMLREAMRMDGHGYNYMSTDGWCVVCMHGVVCIFRGWLSYVQVCVYVHADNTSWPSCLYLYPSPHQYKHSWVQNSTTNLSTSARLYIL